MWLYEGWVSRVYSTWERSSALELTRKMIRSSLKCQTRLAWNVSRLLPLTHRGRGRERPLWVRGRRRLTFQTRNKSGFKFIRVDSDLIQQPENSPCGRVSKSCLHLKTRVNIIWCFYRLTINGDEDIHIFHLICEEDCIRRDISLFNTLVGSFLITDLYSYRSGYHKRPETKKLFNTILCLIGCEWMKFSSFPHFDDKN